MTRRLHIAHLINGLSAGGAETMLVTNLRNFGDALQNSVVAVNDAPGATPFWMPELALRGTPVMQLGARSRKDLAVAGIRLARWVREQRVDVLHAHLTNAMMTARVAAVLTRTPLVTTLHSLSYEPEILAEYASPHSRKHDVARLAEGLLHNHLDTIVIAVGEAVAQSAQRRMHVHREHLRVIPPPLDLSRRSNDPAADRLARRAALGLSPGASLILHVGRVVPLKGHLDVVRALPMLHERGIDAHFVVVGPETDAAWSQAVRAEVKERKLEQSVHWIGATRDIAPWHAAADVFAFPSRYEGLPIALVEALAADLPCVASDIPSNREVLGNDEFGALVPLEIPALAAALEAALRTDTASWRARSARGGATIRARHDPQRVAQLHESLYLELASRQKTPTP